MGQGAENAEFFCKLSNNLPFKDQGVSTQVANLDVHSSHAEKSNAAPGVQARSGANSEASFSRSGTDRKQAPTALTSRPVVVVDREGMVCGVFSQPSEARAYLMEAR